MPGTTVSGACGAPPDRPLFALVAALVVPVAAVSAATPAECSAQVEQLRGEVAAASFTNAKDRATIDAKLVGAQQKLLQGMPADAIEKLVDARVRVEQLGTAGKLESGRAGSLLAGIDSAIACAQPISPTS
jgi:hypothetical protein